MEQILSCGGKRPLDGTRPGVFTISMTHRVDCGITGANPRANQSTQGSLKIHNFKELFGGPIVKKLYSLDHELRDASRCARIRRSVKSMRIQPISINCASQAVSFVSRQGTTINKIKVPFAERIYVFPFLCDTSDRDYLPQERLRTRRISDQMCRLTVVECEELKSIVQRTKLDLGDVVQHQRLLRRGQHAMDPPTGPKEIYKISYGAAISKDCEYDFWSEIVEGHSGTSQQLQGALWNKSYMTSDWKLNKR